MDGDEAPLAEIRHRVDHDLIVLLKERIVLGRQRDGEDAPGEVQRIEADDLGAAQIGVVLEAAGLVDEVGHAHLRRQLVDAGRPDVPPHGHGVPPLLRDREHVHLVARFQRDELTFPVEERGHVDVEQRALNAQLALLWRQDPVDLHPPQIRLGLDPARQIQQRSQALTRLQLVNGRPHHVAVDGDATAPDRHEDHVSLVEGDITRCRPSGQILVDVQDPGDALAAADLDVAEATLLRGAAGLVERLERRGDGRHLVSGRLFHLADDEDLVAAQGGDRDVEKRGRLRPAHDARVDPAQVGEERATQLFHREPVHRDPAHVRNHHVTLARSGKRVDLLYIAAEDQHQLVAGAQTVVGWHGAHRYRPELGGGALEQALAEDGQPGPLGSERGGVGRQCVDKKQREAVGWQIGQRRHAEPAKHDFQLRRAQTGRADRRHPSAQVAVEQAVGISELAQPAAHVFVRQAGGADPRQHLLGGDPAALQLLAHALEDRGAVGHLRRERRRQSQEQTSGE